MLPGPSSPQNKSNSIACEDSSQAGEVRVAVCWLLKHALIQLQLGKRERERNDHNKSSKRDREDGEELN